MSSGPSTPPLDDVAVALKFIAYGPVESPESRELLSAVVDLFKDIDLRATLSAPAKNEAELKSAILAHPSAQVIVLYDRAEHAVLAALEAGTQPLDALDAWEKSTQMLLQYYRKHRRRVLLVDGDQCRKAPEVFIARLAQHLKQASIENIVLKPQPAPAHGMHQIIAIQSVIQSPRAIKLNGELAAGSLPITDMGSALVCDTNQVFKAYQKLNNNILTLNNDVAAAQEQGAAVQQEKAEKDIAILQLSRSQEALEASWIEGRAVKDNRDALAQQVSSLSQQLADQQKTTQELVPLQAKLSLVEQQAHRHDVCAQKLQSEKELLQMQLETVQNEMENYYLEATSLKRKQGGVEKTLGDLAGQVTTAASESTALKQQLEQTQAELDEKNQALEAAQHHGEHLQEQLSLREADLQRVLASNAWKVTGPLRRAKDGLTNRGKREK